MHLKKKGRRIFTYRVKHRRVFSRYHPLRSALGMTLMIAAMILLGIVGYSVIGPLVTRMQQEAQTPTQTPDPYIPGTTTTAASGITTGSPEQSDDTTTTTTTTTAAALPDPEEGYRALYLEEEAMASFEALSRAVSDAKAAGYTAVVLPLKQSGGKLYYASALEEAQQCGAVVSEQTAQQIAAMITEQGMHPIARMVTIADSCYPLISLEAGYVIEETGQRWLDKAEADGGKPWMNPFAAVSRDYLSAIAKELADAGFEQVLCAQTAYPKFYASDLTYIGSSVSDRKSRIQGLTSVLNALGDASAACVYEFDLYEALNDEEEALDREQLTIESACVVIRYHYFSTPFYVDNDRYDPSRLSLQDKTRLLMEISEELTGDMTVYPCIRRSDLSENELNEVLETLHALGYGQVLIQ